MMQHPLMRISRTPRICVWEITRRCNLRCTHCENSSGPASDRELSFAQMEQVAADLSRLGCKMVDITGGEPLLHPSWDRLAQVAKGLGMKTALITNGLLFDDDALSRALTAGVAVVAFSLDGPKPIHDHFRRPPGMRLGRRSPFDTTIAHLGEAIPHINTTVITQVNRLTLPHLGEMRHILRDLGVQSWQLQLTVPTGRVVRSKPPVILEPTQLAELTAFIVDAQADGALPRIDTSDTIGYYTDREPLLRKRVSGQGVWLGCHAGLRAVAITYDGQVRGCSILPPEFDAGSLHDESLPEIWADEERFGHGTRFDPRKLEGDCSRCRFGALCRAGCTAMAYYATGTVFSNPYCISRPGILDASQSTCPTPQGAKAS